MPLHGPAMIERFIFASALEPEAAARAVAASPQPPDMIVTSHLSWPKRRLREPLTDIGSLPSKSRSSPHGDRGESSDNVISRVRQGKRDLLVYDAGVTLIVVTLSTSSAQPRSFSTRQR
jgi:hypothetical protein